MARARNIKPGFFKNEYLPDVELRGRLLFIGLWMLADREGRMEYRPRRIKGELFPYEDCDVDSLVCQLESCNFVERYEIKRVVYLQILNFTKHQNPHPNEKASGLPSPGDVISDHVMVESDRASTLIPSTLMPERGNTPAPGLISGKKKKPDKALFEIWYSAYPNKKSKAQALKAWQKLNPDRSQTAKLIRAVRRESRWRFAMNAADEFVPEWKNPATWLNGQCWDDELIYPKPGDGNGKNSRGYSARSAVERSEDGIRGYLEQQAGTH